MKINQLQAYGLALVLYGGVVSAGLLLLNIIEYTHLLWIPQIAGWILVLIGNSIKEHGEE